MKTLRSEIEAFTRSLGEQDGIARKARRAANVRAMFKDALTRIYKDNVGYVLAHVNAVYIKVEERPPQKSAATPAADLPDTYKALYVYMDDSNYRSDVHNHQHYILLHLKERYGEDIEVFKTYPSRMGMKQRHPYQREADEALSRSKAPRRIPLTEEEFRNTLAQASTIQSDSVRNAYLKAAIAHKEWNKGEALSSE